MKKRVTPKTLQMAYRAALDEFDIEDDYANSDALDLYANLGKVLSAYLKTTGKVADKVDDVRFLPSRQGVNMQRLRNAIRLITFLNGGEIGYYTLIDKLYELDRRFTNKGRIDTVLTRLQHDKQIVLDRSGGKNVVKLTERGYDRAIINFYVQYVAYRERFIDYLNLLKYVNELLESNSIKLAE